MGAELDLGPAFSATEGHEREPVGSLWPRPPWRCVERSISEASLLVPDFNWHEDWPDATVLGVDDSVAGSVTAADQFASESTLASVRDFQVEVPGIRSDAHLAQSSVFWDYIRDEYLSLGAGKGAGTQGKGKHKRHSAELAATTPTAPLRVAAATTSGSAPRVAAGKGLFGDLTEANLSSHTRAHAESG